MGKIHSLETFGTVDGPGVRFVVFFQGCPMRCQYCHNPDTWKIEDGEEMTADEIIDRFERNRSFYQTGGITATGGEPMLQLDFLTELFTKAKEKGIHTCLDTSGIMFPKKHTGTDQNSEREISLTGISENMASDRMEKIEQLMSVTDLVMLDIKHINDEEHQKLTGQPNSNTCIPQQVYHCLALLSCMRRGYAPPPGTTPQQIPISSGAEGRSPMCSASPP